MRTIWRISFVIMSLLSIAGCTLYQRPQTPLFAKPCHFKYGIYCTNSYLDYYWWNNFNDPELNALLARAIKCNFNYLISLKNILIAKTFVAQTESALFPQLNLNFDLSRNKTLSTFATSGVGSTTNGTFAAPGKIFNLAELFASVSYEVDVWNQLGNAVHQAEENVAVSAADSCVIKLTLMSSVTNTYFQMITANNNLRNLCLQHHDANEIVRLTKIQLRSGLIDIGVLEDAKNQAETIRINIEALEKQKETLESTLAYLLGKYPEEFVFEGYHTFNCTNFENLIPKNLPSQMLVNRPDIQEACHQILSYGYLEKENLANFLPSFTLTGNAGYASTRLAKLISAPNTFWNFGLSVVQAVLDFGLRKSLYDRSKFQYESAVLTYKNVVLNAFVEVDTALVSFEKDHRALIAFQNQVINTKRKLILANAQYQSGLTDYLSYLTIDLAYLQSRYNLNNQQLIVAQDIVQVYKSLGLGL